MIKPVIVFFVFFAILISIKFRVNGQCDDNHDYRTVTRCDGSIRSGSGVYADFGKIGRPCTCIVTSSFVGKLHVTSWRATYACNNKVTVNKTVVFNCKNEGFKIYNVQINDTIVVKAEYQPGHTSERFYQCMGFIKYSNKDGKLSVRCGPPPPTTSITTTTVFSTVPRLSKTSSEFIVSSKRSEVALNNKTSAHFSTTYVMNISKADFKAFSEKLTTTDLENKKGAYLSTTHSLNTSTADLKSSSNEPTTIDPETKKNAYFTTPYVLNTSTADLKSSLEESMNTDPENISVLASIATGGIVLAIALIVCIIILLNRIMKEGDDGLVLKSATVHTNRTFENNSGLPFNPLNNISQHLNEVGNSSAQNQQLGLSQKASKINYKNISHYDVPSNNKPVDQGVYSMAKNVVPNENDELCPDVISEDVYAQVFKQNNSNQLAPIKAQNLDGDELIVMEVEIETTTVKQSDSMDNSKCIDGVCYAKVKLA